MAKNARARFAVGSLVVVTIMATSVSVALATASPRAGLGPTIPVMDSVVFTGNSAAPTITVNGSKFGANPPTAYPAGTTSCGTYVDNGSWYGAYGLWFIDNTHYWQAGKGNASGGNCIGIKLVSWTRTQVVFQFGNAYGSFDHWTVDQGDNFVVALKSQFYGGVASY